MFRAGPCTHCWTRIGGTPTRHVRGGAQSKSLDRLPLPLRRPALHVWIHVKHQRITSCMIMIRQHSKSSTKSVVRWRWNRSECDLVMRRRTKLSHSNGSHFRNHRTSIIKMATTAFWFLNEKPVTVTRAVFRGESRGNSPRRNFPSHSSVWRFTARLHSPISCIEYLVPNDNIVGIRWRFILTKKYDPTGTIYHDIIRCIY